MGLRFRKRIKIAKGINLNISSKSIGISAGVKGARVSINSKGRKTTTLGIPGTGISHVSTSSIKSNKKTNKAYSAAPPKKKSSGNWKTILAVIFLISGIYGLFTGEIGGGLLTLIIGIALLFLKKRARNLQTNEEKYSEELYHHFDEKEYIE